MKKIVIILSVILFCRMIGLAHPNVSQETPQPTSTGQTDGKSNESKTGKVGNTGKSKTVSNVSPIKSNAPKPVIGVTIDKNTLSLKENGHPEQLTATIQPSNAAKITVSWCSSDENVATVDNQGKVTPHKEGNTDITVTTDDGNKTATCQVTVEIDYEPKYRFLLKDSIPKLHDQIRFTPIQKTDKIPDLVSYVLAALSVILIIVLIIFWVDSNKTAKDYKSHIEELEGTRAFEQSEKSGLKNQISKFSSENKVLNDEIQKLRAEIDRLTAHSSNDESSIPLQKSTLLTSPPVSRPLSLYADAIINGQFNRVKEQPDDDTIFELKLNKASDTRAIVTVYFSAHRRVIARPSFLDGCEKQILNNTNTNVEMLRDGIAQKDGNGKWNITVPPEVKIS